MNQSQRRRWLPLALLAAALVIWAALLALGAYLNLSAEGARYDWRKPLVVLGAMGVFLGLWGLALWVRSRRQ